MSSDVTLSAALRSNLLSLQSTQSNIDKVQNALSSGLKVSSALDNPQNFFAARSLNNRAGDLTKLLDGIGQSITSIKQADKSIESLTKLVEQADSIIDSAQTAQADEGVAKITGAISLKGNQDLVNGSNVNVGDNIVITVTNPSATNPNASPYTITATLADNDSIEELIQKINTSGNGTFPNGSYNSAGEAVIEASLNADGFLEIKAKNGGNFTATFTSAAATDAADQAFASALGFGQVVSLADENGSATTNSVQVTAIGGSKLTSGIFYSSAGDGSFANASQLLDTVESTAATGGADRFDVAASDTLDITINDGTVVSVALDTATTIQGLVDSINTNATLKNSIKASYSAETGRLEIEKISANVRTVEIGTNNAAGAALVADFDFGLQASLTSGATAAFEESEVFTFSGASGQLAQLATDYDKVRDQIDALVSDSGYRGVSLLGGDDLTTFFNEDRSNSLVTSGKDLTTSGLGLTEADFSSTIGIGSARTAVRNALDTVRNYSSSLANDLSIIQARETFTKDTINNLKEGADKLTLADQNEEGAKLLSLQTRQQLGVTALSLAAQSQQSVLRLF